MKRREFLRTVGMGAATLILPGCGSKQKQPEQTGTGPNIIIIFTDDQGYADVGVYGAKGFSTPNLDKMAEEGIRFTDFYASQAVCSASRASLLTGCYAERVGIQGALMPWVNHGLHPDEDTIADVLKKKNYATAIFGKWHLGHHPEFLPTKQGFDEYLGLPYSNDMWPVDYDGTPLTSAKPGAKAWKSNYPPLPLIEGDKPVTHIDTLEDQDTLTTRYTERAVRFIETNKEKPFFLYLAHSMPHVPLGVSEKFKGKSQQGMYGDVIMEIDWSVGEILKTLKQNELDENTLVIFTSDNGPWLSMGNHGGSALPLREGKGSMWEGGPRVPCIMRWPGRIPAGAQCGKLASTIDFLPTIAAITGAPLPEKKIDGLNILPLMEGKTGANPRNQFLYYYYGELRAVREGKWKLVFPHKYTSYQGVEHGKDGYPGPYHSGKCGLELYDLEADIGETNNVLDRYPKVAERLKKLAEDSREDLGDRLTKRKGKNVRPPGRRGPKRNRNVKHLAVGKAITLKTNYHSKYSGKGDKTLIDGQRGTFDYHDQCWLGFEQENLEATIDLGEVKSVRQISAGFMEQQVSWIFLPKAVEIAISTDGVTYKTVKRFQETTKARMEAKIKDYTAELPPTQTRHIRIKAINIGTCPEWHPGNGGKSWIFADEIIIN